MSHNSYPNADNSGFNYSSAAGIPTNIDQTHVTILPTTSSSTIESPSTISITTTTTQSNLNNHVRTSGDLHYGKLNDEHGGAGTRADDRKGENVKNDGYTATPVAQKVHP
ncbi:unnamed protein product [Rotaria sp. Silwood1]|nr:unnamed protein product [Rotaria sp. Silwood1]CAF0842663.1 unnamed protein product [Rotaria sp. Silwood1]CAF0953869.1 unnamed protein product [Rotaria sp. Silwood1]CAF3345372.1 unnamed protein product [Rotaria sp. Silwood1]CAF3368927.1 unnamed protein product [Rotaria sp. Silwood1]